MKDGLDTNKTEINQRITKIKTFFCNSNNGAFAAKLGVKEQYASNICNGTKATGPKLLDKILEAFPEVNRTWLILGEGEMLVEPKHDVSIEARDKAVVNSISHTGSSCNNTIQAEGFNERLMSMYEDRLADKDSMIETLRETIQTLQGEVEQLRAYVKLTSTKYIEEIERMRNITSDTHDMVKKVTSKIGFKH